MGRGRQIEADALDKLMQAAHGPRGLDETAIYRGIDHLVDTDDPRRRVRDFTHGGVLLDVLGGQLDPLTGRSDAASEAGLAFVQLPLPAALDSTGGSLAPHLLDGVRQLLTLAGNDEPLIVSISYGGQAGPHDGTSLIEQALQELGLAGRPNFGIVLAAGNARRSQAHARRRVGVERSALLRCQMAEGDTTDSFIEAWYDRPDGGLVLEARARTPAGTWSPWVRDGQEAALRDGGGDGEVVALLRHDAVVGNGVRGLLLLATGPTAPRGIAEPTAPAGEWQLEVRLQPLGGKAGPGDAAASGGAVWLDAWVERDDPARGSTSAAPYFLNQLKGDDCNTLSSIATGAGVLRAGGFNLGTGEPADYSAVGARRSHLPEVLAACALDEATPYVQAAATRSGVMMRMSGTSVAAPVLARRLFNAVVQAGQPVLYAGLRDLALQLAKDGQDPALMLPLPETD